MVDSTTARNKTVFVTPCCQFALESEIVVFQLIQAENQGLKQDPPTFLKSLSHHQ